MPSRARTKTSNRLLLAAVLALLFPIGPAAAQVATPLPTGSDRSVEWLRFDVELEIWPDGVLHVTEREEVAFIGGPFRTGFAELSLRNVDGIERVGVGELTADGRVTSFVPLDQSAADGTPGTFRAVERADEVRVDWWFTPTSNADRTFVLEYDVLGALRIDAQGSGSADAELWWVAIGEEVTESGPIGEATVALRLPAPVDPNLVLVSPLGYVPGASDDWSVWTWRRAPLPQGDGLAVRLRFPAQIVPGAAATPSA